MMLSQASNWLNLHVVVLIECKDKNKGFKGAPALVCKSAVCWLWVLPSTFLTAVRA